MKAINLIPPEERRGAGGIAGRAGGAAYVLIAGLVALVALGIIYAFAVHDVATRTTTLAQDTDEVTVVSQQAAALAPYVAFESASEQRVASVATVAEQRFDWARAMQQLALALPSTVTLSSLNASTSTGATGASGVTGSVNAAPGASFTLQGCASTQLVIADALARVRALRGVADASVSTYTKVAGLSLAGSGGTAFQPCARVSWNMTIDYSPGYGIPAPTLPAGVSTTGGG